jgi:pyruvate/2-oxoglutarate dehydrogenase complex dihydrolipoamide acyltransferase (E2) component
MRIPILMPQLGESIAEATILRIEVAPGDFVHSDQEIIEVETQKATMSVTIPCSGQIEEFTCRTGESYPVGSTLGYLTVTEEEAARAGIRPASDAPAPAEAMAAPGSDGDNVHFRPDAYIGMHPAGAPQVLPTLTGLPVPVNATGASYISPRLRVRMQELGLNAADLSAVAGSGAGGRVTVEDFEAFMTQLEEHRTTPASPMRIAVADSMRRSWTRPLANIGIRVNMDPLLAHRKRQREPKAGPALYAMRALAIALSENTAPAGRLVGKRIVHPPAIDLGFAVEVDEGVLVPVIRAVDQKPLASLVEQYNELVRLARTRKLPPDARGPGIATITNFGTFGIEWATPIPLPEQSLLLGLGTGIRQPVWDAGAGAFMPQTQSGLTLSFDHRVIDGGAAGRLLHRVASLMQTPEAL